MIKISMRFNFVTKFYVRYRSEEISPRKNQTHTSTQREAQTHTKTNTRYTTNVFWGANWSDWCPFSSTGILVSKLDHIWTDPHPHSLVLAKDYGEIMKKKVELPQSTSNPSEKNPPRWSLLVTTGSPPWASSCIFTRPLRHIRPMKDK